MSETRRILDLLESEGLLLTRRQLLRLSSQASLALGGLALLGAADPEPVAGQGGGGLRVNTSTDIQQLDPHLVTAWNDYCPWESTFSSLTALDRDFQPIPDLASAWTQPDPKTYLFTLRQGVLFHNGREMKADDVKFSYERIQSLGGKSKWYTLLLDLDRVEVLESLRDLRATPGITVYEPKASSAYAVILIKHAPPLDNKKLRQALAMLVDREALNRTVYYGVGTIEQGCNPFPVGHWAHENVSCPRYDPDAAKKLLVEAGHPNGIELEWKVIGTRPDTVKVAEVCKETFRKGGVNLKLVQLEFATWVQQVYRDKQFQLGQTIFLREADPDGLVVSALFTGGQNNPGGYSTKDMDTLLTQGRGELNRDKRKAIYKRIADIVADEVPFIRLQPQPFLWASTSKVGGFYINSQSRPFVALREATLTR
jgi:ABC-type transport system substrate-binding protein